MADRATSFREFYETFRERPVYVILGVQGSGTNLLGRILTRVFGFSVLRDRAIVFNAAARLGTTPSAGDVAREIEVFRRLISPTVIGRLTGRKVVRQNAPFDGIFDELTPAAVHSGADYSRLIYAYRAYSTGAREMAIKSDDIWEHLDQIEIAIPNRRVILLTRDFRDNLASIAGKRFGPVEPICAAQYIKRQFVRYEREFRRDPRNYHVRFETLVESPRGFVEDIARHYGLTPVADPQEALSTIPARSNKIAKWRRLPQRDLAWCEAILRDELRAFGYPLEFPTSEPPGRATVVAAAARDSIKRIPQKLRSIGAFLRAE